jgi:RNA polymerase sigma-70 factor (ECF subfamily)
MGTTVSAVVDEVDTGASAGDAALIRRARAGDREAFGGLVLRHRASLNAIAARLLGSSADVDEVVQEAFVAAWRHLGEFDPAREFGPWLRTICRNRLANHLRDRAARRNRALGSIDEALLAAAPEEAPVDDGARRVAALKLCLSELQPDARALLRERYWTGRAVKDLAAAAGRSEAGLAMALMRLRHALQACVERRLAGGADAG